MKAGKGYGALLGAEQPSFAWPAILARWTCGLFSNQPLHDDKVDERRNIDGRYAREHGGISHILDGSKPIDPISSCRVGQAAFERSKFGTRFDVTTGAGAVLPAPQHGRRSGERPREHVRRARVGHAGTGVTAITRLSFSPRLFDRGSSQWAGSEAPSYEEANMTYRGMTVEEIKINGDQGTPISAYTARPSGPGPFPGVVLVHHLPGWSEWYIEQTRRFAHNGYLAICANLYERSGQGNPDDVAAKVRADGGISDAQMVGDTEAAVKWMRAQPGHNGKVGLFGSCSGGRHAFIYACSKKDVDACVDLWGGRVVMAKEELNAKTPTSPIELTKNLSCPLLGIFGNEDRAPSPEQVDQHEAELKKHGKTYEFYRYDGAGHGIFYYHRPLYRVEQALDGWNKVFAFFGKHLAR
jgi:carboxymethylenebutenolidase